MTRKTFTTTIDPVGPGGRWTRMQIPFDAEKAFGARGRVAVAGTLNGFPFRTSILPNGDGSHHMMLNKAILAGADVTPGAKVRVVMEKDEESRDVETPADLSLALDAAPKARSTWSAKTPTFRAEYVRWLDEAKAEATRARRIATTVERVAEGKRRYD